MPRSQVRSDSDPAHPSHSRSARSRSSMSSSCKRIGQNFQKRRRAPSLSSDLSDISEESDSDDDPAVVGAGARRHRWESWEAWQALKEEVTEAPRRPTLDPPPGLGLKVMRAPPGLPVPKQQGLLDDLLAGSEPDGPVTMRSRRATVSGPPTEWSCQGGGIFESTHASDPAGPLSDRGSESPASSRSSPTTPVQYPALTPVPTQAAMSSFGGQSFWEISFGPPTVKKHSRMFSDLSTNGRPCLMPIGTPRSVAWLGQYTG